MATQAVQRSMRILPCSVAALAAAILCAAQTAAPAFEVASVKVSTPDERGVVRWNGREFTSIKTSLRQLIMTGFKVRDYSLSGPSWLESAEFDVVAKMPE